MNLLSILPISAVSNGVGCDAYLVEGVDVVSLDGDPPSERL